ncbi:MAG: PEP-CTERM sorting domain-containing protein [Verrucomicrobia bacterium]|nr:MAG: PEP-CTERM sorting domain-containing protein [Verrucomicrobiota bacterium]
MIICPLFEVLRAWFLAPLRFPAMAQERNYQQMKNMKISNPLSKKFTSFACVLASAFGLVAESSAATVVWQTPTALNDWTDIYDASFDGGSDPGKSVYQRNFIGYTYVGTGTTISSWPVADQQSATGDNDFLIGSFDGGSTHNDFIDSSPTGWNTTGMTTIMDGGQFDFTTFTLSNLTVGQQYLIQFLVADNRSYIGPVNRNQTITAGGSTSGLLTYGVDAPSFASSVIGTFTADATSLDFTFSANQSTQVNSIFVTAVPEPSAALLGGLGVLALLRRRRA